MTREEILEVLMLLSTLDGYIIGSRGAHQLPDYLSEHFTEVVEKLSNKIKDKQ